MTVWTLVEGSRADGTAVFVADNRAALVKREAYLRETVPASTTFRYVETAEPLGNMVLGTTKMTVTPRAGSRETGVVKEGPPGDVDTDIERARITIRAGWQHLLEYCEQMLEGQYFLSTAGQKRVQGAASNFQRSYYHTVRRSTTLTLDQRIAFVTAILAGGPSPAQANDPLVDADALVRVIGASQTYSLTGSTGLLWVVPTTAARLTITQMYQTANRAALGSVPTTSSLHLREFLTGDWIEQIES